MKCPFCKNTDTVLMVEVQTDDCCRVCWCCTNCGLRAPGAEITDNYDDEQLALQFWNEMCNALEKVWPE